MISASLPIMLYLFSASVRLLLANAMGLSMLLSGPSSLGQLVLFLVCINAAPSPTPDASVSMYGGFISSKNFIHASSLMITFVLLNIFWYVAFQVLSVLTDMSFLSGSHLPAVLRGNLHK